MSLPPLGGPPRWSSRRRLLERHLADLHRCSNPSHLAQLHPQLLKSHLHLDPLVASKLVSAYSLRRLPSAALSAFLLVPDPNTHLFNTLIRALAHNSLPALAFSAFSRMRSRAVPADSFTFPFLLKACSGLRQIQALHAHTVKSGFLPDIFVPNSLIDSYSRVPHGLASALNVFDEMPRRDTVSHNSVIAALVRGSQVNEARRVFDGMPERDIVSYNTMLDGHAKDGDMDVAFELFERMPERSVVSWSTVVAGYWRKGDVEMARMLFDRMPVKNLVTWTIMISGYAEKGLAKEASGLLDRMLEEGGLELDGAAAVSILAACAESGLLSLGKRIHACVGRSKLRLTTQVRNALVDMYAKCGNLSEAWSVFEGMGERDLVSWNSMVQGLAMHGHGEKALELFGRMKGEGVRPDGVTMIGVLSACTHVGLIDEGRRYFSCMERDYGIVPQIEHYGCVIHLLGRGGLLKEALGLAKSMPWEPNAIIWGSLLAACRVHSNVDIAEEVVDRLTVLEPSDAGNYAILSNIYAAAGRWDGVAKTRIQMKGTGGLKPAGSSWIELNDMVHEFTVADRSHPHSDRIFRMLDRLGSHLKRVGHVPRVYW